MEVSKMHVIGGILAALCLTSFLTVIGCSAVQQERVATAVEHGSAAAARAAQLFCAVNTSSGTVIVGLIDATANVAAGGAASAIIAVAGMSKAFVDAACKTAGGIPVVPPANIAATPEVAIVPPVVPAPAN